MNESEKNLQPDLNGAKSASSSMLTDAQKTEIRTEIIEFARGLIDIPYVYGAEWVNFNARPVELDCSEMVEGVYGHFKLKMPDGAQNQFDYTVPVPAESARNADLAFFGKVGSPSKIYHVGLVWGAFIIEARGHDPAASFETGKVILRPIERWKNYANFVGFRAHPKLAEGA